MGAPVPSRVDGYPIVPEHMAVHAHVDEHTNADIDSQYPDVEEYRCYRETHTHAASKSQTPIRAICDLKESVSSVSEGEDYDTSGKALLKDRVGVLSPA